jgi:hypothetical protein
MLLRTSLSFSYIFWMQRSLASQKEQSNALSLHMLGYNPSPSPEASNSTLEGLPHSSVTEAV